MLSLCRARSRPPPCDIDLRGVAGSDRAHWPALFARDWLCAVVLFGSSVGRVGPEPAGNDTRGDDGEFLDLRDLRSERLAGTHEPRPVEVLGHLVRPGWYVLRVRDHGTGNRADYTLELDLETL